MSVRHAEVVGANDDPYVLVRIDGPTSDADLEAAAARAWAEDFDGLEALGYPERDVPAWIVGECRLYRWVPDPYHGDGDYARWLLEAKAPGAGAFWAVPVEPAVRS